MRSHYSYEVLMYVKVKGDMFERYICIVIHAVMDLDMWLYMLYGYVHIGT